MTAALLIIDMLNAFDFPEADAVRAAAEKILDPIDHLRQQARDAGVPVVFVNDNYGGGTTNARTCLNIWGGAARLARR